MSTRIVSSRRVLAGWPCFEGTRIPYDTVLRLVDHDTIRAEDVPTWYPTLPEDAWLVAAKYAVDRHLEDLEAGPWQPLTPEQQFCSSPEGGQ